MRNKDKNKNEAIFQATIQLLNEVGFSDISMFKIAKRANVSPSTIYIYFKNKEDMLSKLYAMVKQKMSNQILAGIEDTMPIKTAFEIVIRNQIEFIFNYKAEFLFLEQFSNSPLLQILCLEDSSYMFLPLFKLVDRGIEQKILKECDILLLLVQVHAPVAALVKQHFNGEWKLNEKNIGDLIELSWDAIKA
ncbi:TetR/AcrR family transcriptional regulator [Niallia circulans]|uniref:TetR/AcrR family transcriptional regulator n=1 Tax=Niallia circulans TaxID=1397 RepID=A0A553STE3_NIACI|nr:TetR/AcrR family transcriptional regulator [Niallia circulans]TRZ40275.1 TetR/AcrR family transcriptional regulator [Niallia circulans]